MLIMGSLTFQTQESYLMLPFVIEANPNVLLIIEQSIARGTLDSSLHSSTTTITRPSLRQHSKVGTLDNLRRSLDLWEIAK